MLTKLSHVVVIVLLFSMVFLSCGESTEANQVDSTTVLLPHHMEVDISPYGFLATIQIPDTTVGIAEYNETNWGALEIKVGKGFGISIQSGEGNMELLKKDLKEDLVFTNEIIAETPNSIIYKRTIKDAEIKPLYHFFYFDTIDGYIVEVKSLDMEEYTQKNVEDMLKAAQTLKEKKRITASNKES